MLIEGAIVRPDVGWNTTQDEQVRESVDDLSRVELSFHTDRKALSAVFIQDVESSERPAIIGLVMYKVVRPDMILIFRAQPDARSVIHPDPPFLGLFHWHFKPLAPPQTFDTFVIHLPTRVS